MSGHSKWSTIKYKKGAKDLARGKLFAKLARAIEVAAREGGGDPIANAALGQAIDKAKAASMPNDNIDRAVKRGTGDVEGAVYEEYWYEGYAPGGVALYVQILTDNRNRAASEVRSTFSRNEGNLGEPGSVGYLFALKAYLLVAGAEDDVMMAALEAGAEDVQPSGDLWEVTGVPGDLSAIRRALEAAGLEIETAEVTQMPSMTIPVAEDQARRVLRIVDALEDLDDVQAVFANFDISDEVLASLAG
ncbi:MAG: YebC/PmpR family DNA-binding transcriptional regulator [Actinobacteria bacterium]|jgi:YebC/PmpR family DNA-binding regulatory protein|nr:YebC/PmpR family DNA-binding transcriptional regulator [Actinomycetota bacterium]MBU1494486.1 YebC/PmpR family DNA-binding transcriptional regulator [Actinomycetota bacterium]MBU1866295.1 YebC/PmpR family DNA-binding transcriptional regulator [Actinomycetota bacterium]